MELMYQGSYVTIKVPMHPARVRLASEPDTDARQLALMTAIAEAGRALGATVALADVAQPAAGAVL